MQDLWVEGVEFHMKRTLEQSLKNAERLREEIPQLIQPEPTEYDMILLADEVYKMRVLIKEAICSLDPFDHKIIMSKLEAALIDD